MAKRRKKDPHTTQRKTSFGKGAGKSQTMKVSAGKMPKVASTHAGLHHGKRKGTRRAH